MRCTDKLSLRVGSSFFFRLAGGDGLFEIRALLGSSIAEAMNFFVINFWPQWHL